MSSTPESKTISMVIKEWQGRQNSQRSPVHRINGFPWYLKLNKGGSVYLVCNKSSESELWQCTANIKIMDKTPILHSFNSWDDQTMRVLWSENCSVGTVVNVDIITNDDGDSWRRRCSLNPTEPRDGILVIGEDKKKVYVNKQALSSQSSFFDKLFNGDFKEKHLEEIPIGDVEYEEFCNIIGMAHGFSGSQLDDSNVRRILQLADRFDLKIVEDRVVSYFLTSWITSSFTIVQTLLLSEQYNLTFLKDHLLSKNYTNDVHKAICIADEMKQLSAETLGILYEKASNKLP